MKPPPFEYYPAFTVEEAIELLTKLGPEVKILAGGQSLLPMMKLRLARPSALVDLNRLRELAYIRHTNGALVFGAMARLAELESVEVRSLCPMLAAAARQIGHPAIRHRGTVGGSLAHADPAAELPVLALALDAELRIAGPNGERLIPARDFFVTFLTTNLAPDEILTEVRFPVLGLGSGWGFTELSRRYGDFAIVLAAVMIDVGPDGTISRVRIAVGSVADCPVRCAEAEAALLGKPGGPGAFQVAAAAAASPLDPPSDVHGSSAYRRHLVKVLVERALSEAWQRVTGEPRSG